MKRVPGGFGICALSLSLSLSLSWSSFGGVAWSAPPPDRAPPQTPAPPNPNAAAAPAAAAPGAPPTPAPQLAQLKYFVGTWQCDGKGFPSPFAATEHPIKATARVKWDLDNFWQTFVYEEKKTKEHPHPTRVAGTWGWDAGGKRFVRADADAFGGWFTPTSTGWTGDRFLWVGELSVGLGILPARHTFTKKTDREFVHAFEINLAGKATPIFELTCKR